MSARDHPNAWHAWYDTARWQRLRAHQLLERPLCAICARKGLVQLATIVDHVEPHRGDWMKFCTSKLQSLCKPCHDGEKRTVEVRGYSTEIGLDGWPTDRNHPAYRGKAAFLKR
jgi:5-methylcytosine-specific restriction protein A